MTKTDVIEGSMAVAEAVKLCRPHVISAYPITPQTHIVEDLSQMVADGDIDCEYFNVESEFAAASVCLGAAATGLALLTRQLDFNQLGSRVAVVTIWLLVGVTCLRSVRSRADPSPAALFAAGKPFVAAPMLMLLGVKRDWSKAAGAASGAGTA